MSSENIKQDIKELRGSVENTASAIEDRIEASLTNLAEWIVNSEDTARLARNVRDSLRANPWPLAVVGIGIAWIVFDCVRRQRDAEAVSPLPLTELAPDTPA